MTDIDQVEKLMLKFQTLMTSLEGTHNELYKLCVKGRVTSGRDFRRKMREIKALATEALTLSKDVEKNLREEKEEKKNAS